MKMSMNSLDHRSPLRLGLLAMILGLPAGSLRADAQEIKAAEGPSSWLPILKDQAADYRITLRGDSKAVPKPLPEPILRWTQPVRGGDDGAVFLWTADGRLVAVGTIFTYRTPGSPRYMQHEVHSLSRMGLDAAWRGRPEWRAAQPGLTFQTVPKAPIPAATAPDRLRRMQAIARDFSAISVHEKAGRNELRLMPKALYRYEAANADTIDGALYCFAHGTDPELFLVLEARKQGEGGEWQYALARFSDLELHARYQGTEVWDVPHGVMEVRDRIHAYYVVEKVDADTPRQYRDLAEKSPRRDER